MHDSATLIAAAGPFDREQIEARARKAYRQSLEAKESLRRLEQALAASGPFERRRRAR